ncbi:hypothetical protein CLV78_102196 [Aliiruegeria haliotis]|uniref:Uncharacterized protein n=1 Tax=Aliiruegeria haliotis TaxID=1280846 RepID=A0A2T0RUZ3_9RHOB|nr:hypothetical protein [Aliiruegeria haliotis]PRY25019.1 hypothetical protein CLV78_102196 [Aliiruegeria haliotis]
MHGVGMSDGGGIVLMIGSGPDATRCRDWPRGAISTIVAINNAWQLRPDWDYLAFPDDFAEDRKPHRQAPSQRIVRSDAYVPANNTYGGVLFAGGTMAFSAAYWALAALKPRVLAFLGCDMVYPATGRTHFYGTGSADPLRRDVSLRDLEAKSARLELLAAQDGCACVRLSEGDSRLTFPPVAPAALSKVARPVLRNSGHAIRAALDAEIRSGMRFDSGRYWDHLAEIDIPEIDEIDRLWRHAFASETGRHIDRARSDRAAVLR